MWKTICWKSIFFIGIACQIFHFSLPVSASEYKYDLSLTAIFQNDARFLKEWIEFHKLVGVQHFYLYNNLSSDNYFEILKPYISSGEVDLIQWGYNTNPDGSNWPTIQLMACNHALQLALGNTKWLAILDTDEFLFPIQTDSCVDFLADYEEFGGVCANWQMFGTSGIAKIPADKLLIESLLLRAPVNYGPNGHVKSIVRPEHVLCGGDAHICIYQPGYFAVNSNKEPCHSVAPVNVDKIRINHYWTRDEDFFYSVKLQRRLKWREGLEGVMQRANELNAEPDEAILKYVSRLKEAMKAKIETSRKRERR